MVDEPYVCTTKQAWRPYDEPHRVGSHNHTLSQRRRPPRQQYRTFRSFLFSAFIFAVSLPLRAACSPSTAVRHVTTTASVGRAPLRAFLSILVMPHTLYLRRTNQTSAFHDKNLSALPSPSPADVFAPFFYLLSLHRSILLVNHPRAARGGGGGGCFLRRERKKSTLPATHHKT